MTGETTSIHDEARMAISLAQARESMLDARVEGPASLGQLRDRVADDPALMEIARFVSERHHAQGNLQSLFFHGVLFLGAKYQAVEMMSEVGKLVADEGRLSDRTFSVLRAFALEHARELATLLGRPKQTNNVIRSAALLPAFCLAGQWAGAPLGLVELGPSAGINLCWDHFAYTFEHLGHRGQSESSCVVPYRIVDGLSRGEVEPTTPWLPDLSSWPTVASRCGLELDPIDLDSPEALLWLRSWSAGIDPSSIARFDAAISIVRRVKPGIVAGDAVETLARVVDAIPTDVVPCLFSSFMVYQLEPATRAQLTHAIEAIGARRRAVHISLGDAHAPRGARLDITYLDPTGVRREVLGYCNAVGDAGTELTWLGGATPDGRSAT